LYIDLQEAEAKDQFNIEISVNNPSKVGDGMNAYMVYQVNTVVSIHRKLVVLCFSSLCDLRICIYILQIIFKMITESILF